MAAHLPVLGLESTHREPLTSVTRAWPVRCQTYSYLPSCKASPPVGWYRIMLFGDRGKQLTQGGTRQRGSQDLNPRPVNCKLSALPAHTWHYTCTTMNSVILSSGWFMWNVTCLKIVGYAVWCAAAICPLRLYSSVCVWDIRGPKLLKATEERNLSGIPTTFKHLDLNWKPHLKVSLKEVYSTVEIHFWSDWCV